MSLSHALSNAMSGLTATTRGTEVVASNIANAATPGYAKRSMITAPALIGGVRIDGVARSINAALVSEARSAESAQSEAQALLDFLTRMEDVIGNPGEAGSLTTVLTNFRSALLSAASRPDDEIRLAHVVTTAEELAQALSSASESVQTARTEADEAIAANVATMNAGLERVAFLNRRITVLQAQGADPTALEDERQQVISQIASIVPVQEISRANGQVSLFTAAGGVLLDGERPNLLSFSPSGPMDAQRSLENGALGQLSQNGQQLNRSQMQLFSGGSLAAHFSVRDELAPQFQQELDALAYDLLQRCADPAVDPTIDIDGLGMFTDDGSLADPAQLPGLASRLLLNPSISTADGELWRIRSGMGATVASEAGDASYLNALLDAFDLSRSSGTETVFASPGSLESRFSLVESRAASIRVGAEADAALRASRSEALAIQIAALGVDSDAEMQMLLQYEQSYAANARVIQAIDDMMDQILRIA